MSNVLRSPAATTSGGVGAYACRNEGRRIAARTAAARAGLGTLALTGLLVAGCASSIPEKSQLNIAGDAVAEKSREAILAAEGMRDRLEQVQRPPAIQPIEPSYNPLDDIRVTLAVENGDVRHILQALAEQVDMNLVIHPNLLDVPHRISVHFRDAPASMVFREVLRITDVSGRIEGDLLIVNPLEERVLPLDFMDANTQMQFSSGGDVLGANQGSGAGGSGFAAGSSALTGSFRIDGRGSDFANPYDELERMLDIMIGHQTGQSMPEVIRAQSPEEVSSLATLDTARRGEIPVYSLNRMTGTLYIRAKPSVVHSVSDLVQRYRDVLARQVLIEAQIIEVALNDEFRYGVDWSFLKERVSVGFGTTGQNLGGVETQLPNPVQGDRSLTIPGQTLEAIGRAFTGGVYVSPEFALSIELLKVFGDVSVLSHPSVRSKHGQPSLISVGRTNTFVSRTGSTVVPGTTGATVTQDVQTSSVFDGLIVGLLPFIADNGAITLSIHPIQSSVDQTSLALVDVGGESRVTLPRVDLKEISTTLSVRDGDVVILGGLIDRSNSMNREQVPGLGAIPGVGVAFRRHAEQETTRELVIVLKVTLL